MNKQFEEDKNSIIFNCIGAIDFSEQINIELSLMQKEGFIEIQPLLLFSKLNELKGFDESILEKIVKKIQHISDNNEDLSIEHRFTKIFYKCYKIYYHSHQPYGKYTYTNLTLDDSIKYVIKENFDIYR